MRARCQPEQESIPIPIPIATPILTMIGLVGSLCLEETHEESRLFGRALAVGLAGGGREQADVWAATGLMTIGPGSFQGGSRLAAIPISISISISIPISISISISISGICGSDLPTVLIVWVTKEGNGQGNSNGIVNCDRAPCGGGWILLALSGSCGLV